MFYVPAYSRIYHNGGEALNLAITVLDNPSGAGNPQDFKDPRVSPLFAPFHSRHCPPIVVPDVEYDALCDLQ